MCEASSGTTNMRWGSFSKDGVVGYGSVSAETMAGIRSETWGDTAPTRRKFPLPDIKLEVPVVPGSFYCAGINYITHVREMADKQGVEPVFPEKADIGNRANNALIAHEEAVVIPPYGTNNQL